MLRSLSRDVRPSLWAHHRVVRRTPPRRLYSPLNHVADQQPAKPAAAVPPHAAAPRKPKVDLRPAPVKPKSLSDVPKTGLSNAPVRTKPVHKAPEPLSLNEAKVTVQHDITAAQQHGILTPPPPDATWFKATLHKLIQLTKFYFRGVKLIFTRRKEIAAIRERIKAGGAPMTRAEFRFIQTQKDDINKVIPFIIIALLLEEVIPLIAIYVPSMLPSTCILPSQRERIDAKRREKALASFDTSTAVFASLKSMVDAESRQLQLKDLVKVSGAPTTLCSVLGLSTLGIDALRIRRIHSHLSFITKDDALLLQDQLNLSQDEVTEALDERGLLPPTKANLVDRNNLLNWWLSNSRCDQGEDPVARRLFLIVSRQ